MVIVVPGRHNVHVSGCVVIVVPGRHIMHTFCIIPWIIDQARVCVCHTVCMEMTSTKIAHMATQLNILYHNLLKEIESEMSGVKL